VYNWCASKSCGQISTVLGNYRGHLSILDLHIDITISQLSRHERHYTRTLSGSRGLSIEMSLPNSQDGLLLVGNASTFRIRIEYFRQHLSSEARVNARYSPVKISHTRGPREMQSPRKSRLLSSGDAQFAQHRHEKEEPLILLLVFDFAPAAVCICISCIRYDEFSLFLSLSLSLIPVRYLKSGIAT